jgi:hypothetical protein
MAKTNGRKKTAVQKERELRKKIKEELAESQHRKEKIWSNFLDVVDTLSMIIAAGAGIVLSNYMPQFREGLEIIFTIPSWGRLVISGFLSLGVLAMTEIKGSKTGKRKNWLKRIWFAFANGLTRHTILGF